MKKKHLIAAMSLVMVLCVLPISASAIELCFQVVSSPPGLWKTRLVASMISNDTYSIYGRVVYPETIYTPCYGTAIVKDGSVIFSMTGNRIHASGHAYLEQWYLELPTLSGVGSMEYISQLNEGYQWSLDVTRIPLNECD